MVVLSGLVVMAGYVSFWLALGIALIAPHFFVYQKAIASKEHTLV
jgi:predicted metal-binding membrane protein